MRYFIFALLMCAMPVVGSSQELAANDFDWEIECTVDSTGSQIATIKIATDNIAGGTFMTARLIDTAGFFQGTYLVDFYERHINGTPSIEYFDFQREGLFRLIVEDINTSGRAILESPEVASFSCRSLN